MTVSAPAKPEVITAQDLERLSAQGFHYELIQGELYEMVPPGGMHGSSTSRLSFYATKIVIDQDLGETFAAETGFLISRNPDTVLAPDFAFVAKDRLPNPLTKGYVPVVPDIILETRSPNDTKREVADKVERWVNAGVRLVWELDPATQILTVYRDGAPPRALGITDTLSGEDILPDFSIAVTNLFPASQPQNF